MKKLIFLFCLLILTSCKKENVSVQKENPDTKIVQEGFVHDFTVYSNELIIGIGGWAGGCQGATQYHSHGIRFIEGLEYDGKYFYSIETNMLRYNECDTFYLSNWQSLNKYYRYSFEEKRSYIYNYVDDISPELIFDFNCNVGDTLLLNQDKLVRMVVTFVGEQTVNGIEFPVVKGRVVSFSRTGSQGSNDEDITPGSAQIIITPFSPNPFWTGNSLNSYFSLAWDNELFCVPVTATSIYYLGMSCRIQSNEQYFYNYGFLVPY